MPKTVEVNEKLRVSFEPVAIVHNKYRASNVMLDANEFNELVSEEEQHQGNDVKVAIAKYFSHHNERERFDKQFQDYLDLMYVSGSLPSDVSASKEFLKKLHLDTSIFTHEQMVHLLDDLQGFRQHCEHLIRSQMSRNIMSGTPKNIESHKRRFEKSMMEFIWMANGLINLVMKCIKNFNLSEEFLDEYHGNDVPPLPEKWD